MGTKGERDAAREVLAKAKAKTSRCRLLLDGDLEDELDEAHRAFDAATEGSDEAAELGANLRDVAERATAAETEFVFRVGRGRWRMLQADYPPTDEQKAEGAEFDVDEFPFVAMAEFLVTPKLTAEELKELNEDALDEVKFSTLWSTCLGAYFGGRRPPSEAARRLLSEHGSSARPSELVSPAAS